MELEFGIFIFSFVASVFAMKLLNPIAYWAELVDKPGGRKHHEGLVPLIGGISIYICVCVTTLLFLDQPVFIRLFLLAGGLIVFMGMIDDRYDLSARSRLLGQVLICSIFVYGLDVKIDSFGNILGYGQVSPGFLGYPLTVLSLMGAMNAFNFLDGIDGIVGLLALASFVALSFLFGQAGESNFSLLCVAFVGAISSFLIFNIWGCAKSKFLTKIFMGDAGSMFIGLSLGVLLVQGSQGETPAFSPVTSLWLVLLPMLDMFTIMYRRVKRGRSPMAPDRTHIHHMLLRAGFKKYQTLSIVGGLQVLLIFSGLSFFMLNIGDTLSFILAAGFVILYQIVMKRSWRLIRWSRRHLT